MELSYKIMPNSDSIGDVQPKKFSTHFGALKLFCNIFGTLPFNYELSSEKVTVKFCKFLLAYDILWTAIIFVGGALSIRGLGNCIRSGDLAEFGELFYHYAETIYIALSMLLLVASMIMLPFKHMFLESWLKLPDPSITRGFSRNKNICCLIYALVSTVFTLISLLRNFLYLGDHKYLRYVLFATFDMHIYLIVCQVVYFERTLISGYQHCRNALLSDCKVNLHETWNYYRKVVAADRRTTAFSLELLIIVLMYLIGSLGLAFGFVSESAIQIVTKDSPYCFTLLMINFILQLSAMCLIGDYKKQQQDDLKDALVLFSNECKTDEERYKTQMFLWDVDSKPFYLSVGGFFNLNKSFLTSFAGIMTTYILAMMQLE